MDIIKSKQFILRPFGDGDEQALIESINDADVHRYMTTIPFPYKAEDATWWLNHCKEEAGKRIFSEINFAIDIAGKVVGGIALKKIEEKHKAEIGYWLAKKYWGQGIMTEVAKLNGSVWL